MTGKASEEVSSDNGKRHVWRSVLLVLFLGVLFVLPVLFMLDYAMSPRQPGSKEEIVVSISAGSTVNDIGKVLAISGVLNPGLRFAWLARIMGKANRLKAGEYAISPGLTPVEILRMLERGAVTPQRAVTIPEGYCLEQIAKVITGQGLATTEEFLALSRDPKTATAFGLEASTLEGYLFPDTYFFYKGMKPRHMIRTMVERFFEVYAKVEKEAGKAASLEFTRHQRVTLASIVEKETAVPLERPLIARVFLNRLQQGMRLQTDPTVIYGIANFNGDITKKDLETWSPYNTYLVDGLPPGPIASPGRASLEAVFKPAETPSLFFVSKNDGTHFFSTTLEEHNRAVRKYQKTAKTQ